MHRARIAGLAASLVATGPQRNRPDPPSAGALPQHVPGIR